MKTFFKNIRAGKALVFITLIMLLCLNGFLSVTLGAWHIEIVNIIKILLTKMNLISASINNVETVIIWEGRIPRFITAFLVGFSLASSGCIMQGVFKNPMASPGVLGISSGAALGAVTAIYSGLAGDFLFALPFFAILASLLTLALVFAIASSGGYTSISTLLLAGIALNLIFGALTSFVITLGTREFDAGRVIITWLMGDLNDRSWNHVYIVFPCTIIALAGTFCFVKDLNLLMIDEETAVNLGVNISLARNTLLFFASLQTGGAIAVAGVIGFVGLLAPHIIRGITGPDNRTLIPLSGLLGAVFIVYADLFVRMIIKVDLKVGILTSLMGGPFFLYLLIKNRKSFEYM